MKIGFFNDYQLGAVKGDRIVDFLPALGGVHAHDPQELINTIIQHWSELADGVVQYLEDEEGELLTKVSIQAPLPRPEKLLCMAVNYLENGTRPMPEIDAFLKSSDCVIGDGETIYLDPECNATIFHHEAELAVVIGREAHGVSEAEAMDYVFGYTGFIDVSARGFNPRGSPSFFQTKSWPTFGPMGPFIITKDEIPNPHNMQIRITNNSENRQAFNTSDMAHKIEECIAFCSRITPLFPGDIISTGTNHQGLGAIQDGDQLVLEIEGIGVLHVDVEDPLKRKWPRGIDEGTAERMRGQSS
jgi:2-keto-4-pentenoate hydratase/2-oxohepta-3-ene-1,7-dioic acid hydratase in catechol pathway